MFTKMCSHLFAHSPTVPSPSHSSAKQTGFAMRTRSTGTWSGGHVYYPSATTDVTVKTISFSIWSGNTKCQSPGSKGRTKPLALWMQRVCQIVEESRSLTDYGKWSKSVGMTLRRPHRKSHAASAGMCVASGESCRSTLANTWSNSPCPFCD